MSDVIRLLPQDQGLLIQWYTWGVVVGFVIALAATLWIFVDAQRSAEDATIWKSLAAVASVLGIPALMARLVNSLANELRDSLVLIGYLSMVAVLLAVIAAVAYATTRGRGAERCPICGRVQQPEWLECPYHAAAKTYTSTPYTPITDTAAPIDSLQYATKTAQKETMVNQSGHSLGGVRGGASEGNKTVILGAQKHVPPMAFLAISSGPYAGRTLNLSSEQTRIGRDGTANDHAIDDDAVGRSHVSIKYINGTFVLTDLDSANGTFVNGERVEKHTLISNDVILIGKTKLVFLQVQDAGVSLAG